MNTTLEIVDEAVRRMAAELHPLSIVLFGSAVRGTMGPNSDLDFLVVMPDGSDRLQSAFAAHRSLRGLGAPVDIVVTLTSEVAAQRNNPYMIIHTALTEGREVYHAA